MFNGIVANPMDLISHPLFSTETLENDIGLIHLRTATPAILQHSSIGLINLPNATDFRIDLTNRLANVSGFGLTGDGQPPSDVLRFVTVPIISNQECSRSFGDLVLPSNVCIGTPGGRSPCRGDSGGPLTTHIDRNRTVVVGVVSFGSLYCGKEHPVVFARVTGYMMWINGTVNGGDYVRGVNAGGFMVTVVFALVNVLSLKK